MEHSFGEIIALFYNGLCVASYEIIKKSNIRCDIKLNLYYPFNRHRAILEDIKVNSVEHAVLDYMTMQAYNDTEDRNKMFVFAVVAYFTKQINKGLNNVVIIYLLGC
jgi:hypothetical protein